MAMRGEGEDSSGQGSQGIEMRAVALGLSGTSHYYVVAVIAKYIHRPSYYY